MADYPENAREITERLAPEVVMMDPKNIQGLGVVMNLLDELTTACGKADKPLLVDLTAGIKRVVEKLVLEEHPDPEEGRSHVQEGLSLFQRVLTEPDDVGTYEEEIGRFMSKLGMERPPVPEAGPRQTCDDPETQDNKSNDKRNNREAPAIDLCQDREILESFIMESMESLDTIEVNVLSLEHDPENTEVLNAIFRPFHTIKGGAGFLNLTDINHFAHEVETLLDHARNQKLAVDENVTDVVLDAVDLMKKMMEHVKESIEEGEVKKTDFGVEAFCERLNVLYEPYTQEDEIPQTRANPLDDGTDTGQILIEKGIVTDSEISSALEKQAESGKKLGEVLIEAKKITPRDMAGVLREQKARRESSVSREKKVESKSFVKVDTQKLDNVVDMVGELVITQAMLGQDINRLVSQDNKIYGNLSQLSRITSELQRTSMSLRMVAIRQTFQKMIRLVRDLSKKSGKRVDLQMVGEDTEIDRTMVDEIYDPLVHMVRNAVDHGIEDPETRKAAGKPEAGTIVLKAYHKGGNIVIEISEDGKGLDREKITNRAVERGVIGSGEQMSEHEVHNLIFQPGFSTAETITDVSGRGVGMDVVKRSVENLRGKVEVLSEKGRGTSVLMKLPLTLAIIDGVMVRAGDRNFIIPTFSVLESLRPNKSDCKTVSNKGEMIRIRNSLHPLVRLHELFEFEPQNRNPWEGIVVIAESDGQQKCILVDELLGKQEVVIKSLGSQLTNAKGMAGGAILADGRVGLILDMPGLFELSEN